MECRSRRRWTTSIPAHGVVTACSYLQNILLGSLLVDRLQDSILVYANIGTYLGPNTLLLRSIDTL